MPHYRNGDLAQKGDRVRGRGYNIKGEIDGLVLKVTPGAETCNIVIGTLGVKWDANPVSGQAATEDFREHPTIEYGQADAFDKVAEGEPLP